MVYSEGRKDVCMFDDTDYIQNKWEKLLKADADAKEAKEAKEQNEEKDE